MIELREEAAGGRAARALFDEYIALVRERLRDEHFVPPERIFATEDAFAGEGAAWLVAYRDGEPVGCGGLRTLAPGIGEIKRMFVVGRARGSGVGRALLHALERRARDAGLERVRLLTTPALREACALYAAEGYAEIERVARDGEPVEIWLEKRLAQSAFGTAGNCSRIQSGPSTGRR